MHLTVKNKFFSLGGSSKVLNENNQNALLVKGKMFSPTKKKFVKDLTKKTLFIVRNKFWSLLGRKALIYDGNKNLVATVKREIKFVAGFTITGAEQEIRVDANNIGGLSLRITMGGKEIGTIHRPFLALTDTFELDFADEEDAPFLVALVIAIDNITDRNRKS